MIVSPYNNEIFDLENIYLNSKHLKMSKKVSSFLLAEVFRNKNYLWIKWEGFNSSRDELNISEKTGLS